MLLLLEVLFWTWLAIAAGLPADLASSGFLGLYSVAATAVALLVEGWAGDDSRRRDGFVRFGVMTVRGPAAGDIEDTEIGDKHIIGCPISPCP